MRLTICTPTYNRAKTLGRLYTSLTIQTSKQFEWLVIDDGSTDETEKVVESFIHEKKIEIRYYKQENQGKHVAVNKGVEKAKGLYFFIVDSDDWLPDSSVEQILELFNSIANKEKYAGVAGVKAYSNEKIVGKTFLEEHVDCTSLQRRKYNILGDKAEVFYTDVLRRFPFPVFKGEKFLTESVVWYRIAKAGYKIRWTNKKVYFCEYLDEGLSHTTGKCTLNFEGFKLTVKEELTYDEISRVQKIKLIMACGGIGLSKKIELHELASEIECNKLLLIILGNFGYLIKKIREKM